MHKTINYQGFEFTYHTEGKGNPLFLIHGFCEDNTIWDKIKSALAKKYSLILPDLPGVLP